MQRNNISDPRIDGLKTRTRPQPGNADYTIRIQRIISWLLRFFVRKKPAWDNFNVQEASFPKSNKGFSNGRRKHTSRSRYPHGMPVRQACGRNDLKRPKFDVMVEKNGDAWWYVDGISQDGTKAISIIGFIGSVFSPW